MAFIDIPITHFPKLESNPQTSGGYWVHSPILLNAANEAAVFVFQVPKSGNVSGFAFNRLFNAIHLVTLETLNVDGEPGGKLSALAEKFLSIGIASASYAVQPFNGLVAVKQGDKVCFKITDTDPDPTDKLVTPLKLTFPGGQEFPYTQFVSSGGSHAFSSDSPGLALQYEDGSWPQLINCYSLLDVPEIAFTSATTIKEGGSKFSLRINVRACGFWSKCSGTITDIYTLYDDLDGILFQGTIPNRAVGNGSIRRLFFPVFLPKNKTFRMTVKHGGGAGTVKVPIMEVYQPSMMTVLDGGSDWLYTEKTALGQWNNFTSRRCPIGILVDQLDVDNTGGFGYSPPIETSEMLPVMSALLSDDQRAPIEEPMNFDPYIMDAFPL